MKEVNQYTFKFCFKKIYWDIHSICVEDEINLSTNLNIIDSINSMISKHDIPEFSHQDFSIFLEEKIENEQHIYHQTLIDIKVKEIYSKTPDTQNLTETIKNWYHNSWNMYRQPNPQSDAEIFGNAYLRLVESGTEAMESIAKLELQFSLALSEKVEQRNMILSSLDEHHLEEMDRIQNTRDNHKFGLTKATEINQCEQLYHRDRSKIEVDWDSDITALREHQRRDFREYVMQTSSDLLISLDDVSNDNSSINSSNQKNYNTFNNNRNNRSPSIDMNQNKSKQSTSSVSKLFSGPRLVKRSSSNLGLLSSINKKFGIGLNTDSNDSTTNSLKSESNELSMGLQNSTVSLPSTPLPWQESFTINLGRQLRSSHNMKIISIDPFQMLALSAVSRNQHHHSHRRNSHNNNNSNHVNIDHMSEIDKHNTTNGVGYDELQPEIIANRLNTALSLYSHNLTAMVMLVDNRLTTYNGNKKRFSNLCERSTDFHFPQLENQLEEIRRTLNSSNTPTKGACDKLELGDVYVTQHSNLNVVTVVFHLVIDETTIKNDIKFPSPVHNAIRNILRVCFLHDIFCLNLPLLMSFDLKEYMTPSWCIHRVETVLKAVKGSLMELCTWKGQEPRTIQFLVPLEISHELLTNFSSLLTEYFQPYRAVK